jgi:hypothetical protein
MTFVVLEARAEMDLEKAFERLDLDAIKAMFSAELAKTEAAEDAADTARSESENYEAAQKDAEREKEEAEAKTAEKEEIVEKLEKQFDEIYDLIKPFIDNKTRVQVLKDIWEIVREK